MSGTAVDETKVTLDEATRLMALKQFESASNMLASALETLREKYGEDAPELAPVLHQYGKALLEHCIRTSGALGGGGPAAAAPDADDAPGLLPTGKDPRFSFSGDAEQPENNEAESEKKAAQKRKAPADEEEQDKEGAKEEEGEEEDDDLGVAFTVLDLARVIYQRLLSSSGTAAGSSASAVSKNEGPAGLRTLNDELWDERTIRLELAEVHNDLGDVGLETENFEQASSDYAEALDILLPLLPPFSRRVADAHLRLGLALEFHPSVERRGEAETHIEHARAALKRRAEAVEKREGVQQDVGSLSKKESLADLTTDEAERERKDIEELIGDLENKLEEFKAAPPTKAHNAEGKPENPELEQAIRETLLGFTETLSGKPGAPPADQAVNDLSTLVKKKKRSDK